MVGLESPNGNLHQVEGRSCPICLGECYNPHPMFFLVLVSLGGCDCYVGYTYRKSQAKISRRFRAENFKYMNAGGGLWPSMCHCVHAPFAKHQLLVCLLR